MKSYNTLAVIGCDAPTEITEALSSLGFLVQVLPRDIRLPRPVSSHADMLMFELDGRIFCSKQYFETASYIFDSISAYGYDIIRCDVGLGDKYPDDIAFNMALCDNVIYGSINSNAPEIIKYAEDNGFKLNSVRQGYTKCSTVVLGDKAIITADSGIASSASKNGISVLKISNSPDSVSLDGYNYGFIGGACGVCANNIYFSGDIDLHPQGRQIKDFGESFGFNTINLSDSMLTDVGGIIFLPYLQ